MKYQNIQPTNVALQGINLYQLLAFYASKWIWIVILTVIGALIGFIYSDYFQVPLYKSNATLLLIRPIDKRIVLDATLINNYVELFKSRRVLEPVIETQKLDMSYGSLVNSIEATNSKNTEVIKLSIATNNPKTSKSLVEGSIVSFKEQIAQLYGIDNVQIVDNANLATSPYNVHKEMLNILSATAGFVVSVIVLFFIYDFNLSNSNKSTKNKKGPAKKKAIKRRKATKPNFARKIAEIFAQITNNALIQTSTIKKPVIKSAAKKSTKKSTNKSKSNTNSVRAKKSNNTNIVPETV